MNTRSRIAAVAATGRIALNEDNVFHEAGGATLVVPRGSAVIIEFVPQDPVEAESMPGTMPPAVEEQEIQPAR